MSFYNGYGGASSGCPCNDKKKPVPQQPKKKAYPKPELSCSESWDPYYPTPPPPAPCAPCLVPGAGVAFQLIPQQPQQEFACGSAVLTWQDCEGNCLKHTVESDVQEALVAQAAARIQQGLAGAFATGTSTVAPVGAPTNATVNAVLAALNASGLYDEKCSVSTLEETPIFARVALTLTPPAPAPVQPVTAALQAGAIPGAVSVGANAIISGLGQLFNALLLQFPPTGPAAVTSQLCYNDCTENLGTLVTRVTYPVAANAARGAPAGNVTFTSAALVAFCDCGATPVVLTSNANVTVPQPSLAITPVAP